MSTRPSSQQSGPKLGRPDIEGDTRRLWEVLSSGGIAIIPSGLGYGIAGGSKEAVERINETKARGAHKRNGMFMGEVAAREIYFMDQRKWDIVDCVTKDYDLPLGMVARYRADHPLIQKLDPELLQLCEAQGTMATALNEGTPFIEELAKLSLEHLHPICGSSANLTGTGVKYRVEDIEPEIVAIANIVLDYGLCRYYREKVASTIINFETMELVRWGACFEVIADALKRHFDLDLPPDPGREANPNGHVNEFALLQRSK